MFHHVSPWKFEEKNGKHKVGLGKSCNLAEDDFAGHERHLGGLDDP